jgi:hypothetical protein
MTRISIIPIPPLHYNSWLYDVQLEIEKNKTSLIRNVRYLFQYVLDYDVGKRIF